uniref:Uncharacterized protein n=1 Tax=Hemiselmis andersenii TaxID=464988 RepID=A0A6U2DA43_HEMAN
MMEALRGNKGPNIVCGGMAVRFATRATSTGRRYSPPSHARPRPRTTARRDKPSTSDPRPSTTPQPVLPPALVRNNLVEGGQEETLEATYSSRPLTASGLPAISSSAAHGPVLSVGLLSRRNPQAAAEVLSAKLQASPSRRGSEASPERRSITVRSRGPPSQSSSVTNSEDASPRASDAPGVRFAPTMSSRDSISKDASRDKRSISPMARRLGGRARARAIPCLTSGVERRYLPGVGIKTIKTRQGQAVDVVRSREKEGDSKGGRGSAKLAAIKTLRSHLDAPDGGDELHTIRIRPARFRLLV